MIRIITSKEYHRLKKIESEAAHKDWMLNQWSQITDFLNKHRMAICGRWAWDEALRLLKTLKP